MKKDRSAYLCSSCGARFSRWQGACHACGSWDTLIASPQRQASGAVVFDRARTPRTPASRTMLGKTDMRTGMSSSEIAVEAQESEARASTARASAAFAEPPFRALGEDTPRLRRISTGIAEFDRALGGGIVPGSVLLLGGDPGVGKSTLALQIAVSLSAGLGVDKKVRGDAVGSAGSAAVYVSGEEDRAQLALRAHRLASAQDTTTSDTGFGGRDKDYSYKNLLCTARTEIDEVLEYLHTSPARYLLLVVDSIQTMKTSNLSGNGFGSSMGTLNGLRQLTETLTHFARLSGLAVLLIGHVTKDGHLAGPRQIEHMVDVVLYLEGERGQGFRLLRAVKNRFGAVDEVGVFEMRASGLCGVANPSSLFLSSHSSDAAGTAVFAGIEGTRPFLCEVQALVASAPPGTPRRTALGWDSARLATLLAVLEAHADLRLGNHEVYLSISGGLRIKETACDLAVACALISAARKIPLPRGWVFCGEIGLTGDVRAVGQTRIRAGEARKLGFLSMLLPKDNSRAKLAPEPSLSGTEHTITPASPHHSPKLQAMRPALGSSPASDVDLCFHRVSRVSELAPWLLRVSAPASQHGDAAVASAKGSSLMSSPLEPGAS